jgi:hypothetical protein
VATFIPTRREVAMAVAEAGRDARAQLSDLRENIVRSARERPYPTLLLAAMAGYVMGGGLFSHMTRPLARAAMGALLVPGFRDRMFGRGAEAVGAA